MPGRDPARYDGRVPEPPYPTEGDSELQARIGKLEDWLVDVAMWSLEPDVCVDITGSGFDVWGRDPAVRAKFEARQRARWGYPEGVR
jgi:hypothetical protein